MTVVSSHGHTHAPSHGHTHTRTHTHGAAEDSPGPSEGAVFIEVGPGVGAAVIYTGQDLDGAELEIRPPSEEWSGLHTAVRERRHGDVVQFAAVFGSLAEGDWDVRVRGSDDAQPVLTMRVIGASVIEAVWPKAR
jgi:hypothetical protein